MKTRQSDKWMKRVWLIAIVPVVLIVLVTVLTINSAKEEAEDDLEARYKEVVAALEDVGLTVDPAVFGKRLEIEEADNAATAIRLVGKRFARDGGVPSLWEDEASAVSNCKALDAAEPELFRLLQEAAEKGGCSFDREWHLGVKLTFPEIDQVKAMVRYCTYLALADAEDGDFGSALDRLLVADQLSRHVGRELVLISKLVEIIGRGRVLRAVAKILNDHPDDAEAVRLAVILSRRLTPLSPMIEGLQAEAVAAPLIINMYTPEEVMEISGGLGVPEGSAEKTDAVARKSAIVLVLERVVDFHRIWSQEGTGADIVSQSKALEETPVVDGQPGSEIAQVMMPMVSNAYMSHVRTSVASRALVVVGEVLTEIQANGGALDVASHNGRYEDEMNGSELVVKLDQTGLRVYSKGLDGIDDGGPISMGYVSSSRENDDFGFWIRLDQN